MKNTSIRDNHKYGSVGDFLKEHITEDSSISIVSAFFTIYAYKHLKQKLDSINNLRFLFGEPTFIKAVDPEKNISKNYKIEDNNLVIPIESRLTQKAAAKECAVWLREKAKIRSITNFTCA